ncbi:Protein of unknown function [Halarsenatibacter silvermanii]|uniref:DUF3048 domain-containing protein n=1 Tax=Halarsenatibacter silvermanii TaxID=321763 RepID=A0A1G9JUM0_9FIRM|nr:Protein of unknown function [Halarsenatibacter silvermanii]
MNYMFNLCLPVSTGKIKSISLTFFLCGLLIIMMTVYFIPPISAGADHPPVLVVVDNHPSSQPQAGLNQADIVFEFLVEGGITRFLAGYNRDLPPQRVGPVRSLRPYMVKLTEGFDPVIFHAGGSSKAMENLEASSAESVNELIRPGYFWRDEGRKTPHNLYTGKEGITRAAEDMNLKRTSDNDIGQHLSFRGEGEAESKKHTVLAADDDELKRIELSFRGQNLTYEFDDDSGRFYRYTGGGPHRDETGEIINFKNLAVIFAPHKTIDEEGRKRIHLDSGGAAYFLTGRKSYKGTWDYDSQKDELRLDGVGADSSFAEHLESETWFHVLPEDAEMEIY